MHFTKTKSFTTGSAGRPSGPDQSQSGGELETLQLDHTGQVDFVQIARPRLVTGCVATVAYGAAGKAKILEYDLDKLSKISALLTLFASGSVFRLDSSLVIAAVVLGVVAAGTMAIVVSVGIDDSFDASKLENILRVIANFVPFLLGLYTSLTLARWWTMRAKVDDVVNATSNLCQMYTTFCSERKYYLRFQMLLKFSVASIACVAKDARGSDDLSSLKEQGLLDDKQIGILLKSARSARAQVLWSWATALGVDGFQQAKVPPPIHGMVLGQCFRATAAIQIIQTHRKTQLPFPYVHMITLLVNTHNLFVALTTGVNCAINYQKSNYVPIVLQTIFLFVIPILYQGLLAICALVQDPFGEDLIDLPIQCIQRELGDGCDAVYGTHKLLKTMRRNLNKGLFASGEETTHAAIPPEDEKADKA